MLSLAVALSLFVCLFLIVSFDFKFFFRSIVFLIHASIRVRVSIFFFF